MFVKQISKKTWYVIGGIIVFFALGYFYINFGLFSGSLETTLKNAESVVREKILQITKEISSPGPLWGDKKASNAILTEDGIWLNTNTAREENSENPPLLRNAKLDEIALLRVNDMFKKQYFEHVSPTGESASDDAFDVGYEYIAIGENIALGNFADDAALVQAWMNSPGHRENILSKKYREIGIAAKKSLYDGDEIWIAVQIFGRPLSDCTEPSTSLKTNIELHQKDVEALKTKTDTLYAELNIADKNPSEYNTKVAEYNDLVKKVNTKITETKAIISQYNNQVKLFNICLEN